LTLGINGCIVFHCDPIRVWVRNTKKKTLFDVSLDLNLLTYIGADPGGEGAKGLPSRKNICNIYLSL